MNARPYSTRRHLPRAAKSYRSFEQARHKQCIALIDWKFLSWLAGQSQQDATALRHLLPKILKASFQQDGSSVWIRHIWIYGEKDDGLIANGQHFKAIPFSAEDGGLSIVRAMASDLLSITRRENVEHILIASDDERLAVAIDEAQFFGVDIAMLVNESAAQPENLVNHDASWARLLKLANRRLLACWNPPEDLALEPEEEYREREPSVDVAPILHELVSNWWNDLPQEDKDEITEMMPPNHGVPQEVDRDLLQLSRNRMERPLRFFEKKLLRQALRQVVLGEMPETQENAPPQDIDFQDEE